MKSALRIFNKSQGGSTPRGIYYAKYYGQGGVGEMVPGKKNEKWGSEEQNEKEGKGKKGKRGKGKGKRRKGKGGEIFFLLIYGTLLLIIVY